MKIKYNKHLQPDILSTYNFVQNDIVYGYNESDEIPASLVLKDGYGQCNLKGVKAVLYKYVVSKLINSNMSRIRLSKNI